MTPFRELRLQFSVAVLLFFCCGSAFGQTGPPSAAKPAATPDVVANFVKLVGEHPDAEVFYAKAMPALWEVYPHGEELKKALVAYVSSAPDGPGLGFAGLALIPFHDPTTLQPLLTRALDRKTSPATRWCLLNAVPYIAAMGDVMYMGEGALDKEARELISGLKELKKATETGFGHVHAETLRGLYDAGRRDPAMAKDSDFGLALWHTSAYVLGTLDLRDAEKLDVFLDPKQGDAFRNVIEALCFASNRDFLAALRGKAGNQVKPEQERAAAEAARAWWQAYRKEHPSGEWIPAAVSGFREAGYQVEDDLRSPKSAAELLRALAAESDVNQYNAARLLNHIYGTNFDLERIFFAGKYALSFLDPMSEEAQNKARLKNYWTKRLKD